MGNGSKITEKPAFRSRQKRELAALARELRRQAMGAKAVLLVADALDLSPGDLLSQSASAYQAALRRISVGKLGDVARAVATVHADHPRTGPREGRSLDAVAHFVLDRGEPGSKLDLIERAMVACAMSACSGNQSAAARLLGIERKALARRLAHEPKKPRG